MKEAIRAVWENLMRKRIELWARVRVHMKDTGWSSWYTLPLDLTPACGMFPWPWQEVTELQTAVPTTPWHHQASETVEVKVMSHGLHSHSPAEEAT